MRRLEEQGVMEDNWFTPEYVNAGVLQMAWVFGFMGIVYIGANIHFLGFCIALNLSFGLATVLVWKSGAVPPIFFGQGWRTVRLSEDSELYWLNFGVLLFGFVISVMFTGWVLIDTVAGAA